MEHETFFTLLRDSAHWEFELFLMFVVDGLIGLVLWPIFRKKALHHITDDEKIELLQQQVKALQAKLGIKDEEK